MGRLFRRVVRSARTPRRASRASTVRSADGKQYRVVEVNEAENAEFADPPRKWGRVGTMVGVWALLLALGGWAAPAIAASGNPENEESRETKPLPTRITLPGATCGTARTKIWTGPKRRSAKMLRRNWHLRTSTPFGSPTPMSSGALHDIDLETGDPVEGTDGITIAGTVSYIYEGNQRFEEFVVTVQEDDGTYCVSNAVQVEDEEPSAGRGHRRGGVIRRHLPPTSCARLSSTVTPRRQLPPNVPLTQAQRRKNSMRRLLSGPQTTAKPRPSSTGSSPRSPQRRPSRPSKSKSPLKGGLNQEYVHLYYWGARGLRCFARGRRWIDLNVSRISST